MPILLSLNDPQLDVLLECLEASAIQHRYRDNDHYWLLLDKTKALAIKRQEYHRHDLPLPWRRGAHHE